MEKKAVLWDLDGTLFPSTKIVHDTILEIFPAFNLDPPTYMEVHESFGHSISDILYLHSKGHPQQEAIEQSFRHTQNKHYEDINLFEGMLEVLEKFHKYGWQQAIVTSRGGDGKGPASVHSILKNASINDYLSEIISLDHVKKPKPHPEGIWLAMDKLGVKAQHTVMVGDNQVDVIAANQAKVYSIGVDHVGSKRDKIKLTEAGAKAIASNPKEIITIVEKYHGVE